MALKEFELTPNGDLIVGQDALKEAGLEGRILMIIKNGEIRIVPEAESSIDMNTFPDDKDLVKIDREQQAYKSQHRQILEKHAGNYIALHQGEIVDYDEDRVAISKRVRAKYGNEPVLITKVLEQEYQKVLLRSPRIFESSS